MTTSFLNPAPSEVGVEYWEYCRRHLLAAQRCSNCGLLRRYLTRVCPRCTTLDYRWEVLSGNGTVYACTTVHQPLTAEFEAPYVVALIDLEEGIRVMSNVVGCDPDRVAVGQRVVVRFKDVSDTISIPLFTPA